MDDNYYRLGKDDYKTAIAIQDACNLSAVVHTFSGIVTRLWMEARSRSKGTDWVNTHPIVIMFSSKIDSLCGGQGAFSDAYSECCKRAEVDAIYNNPMAMDILEESE